MPESANPVQRDADSKICEFEFLVANSESRGELTRLSGIRTSSPNMIRSTTAVAQTTDIFAALHGFLASQCKTAFASLPLPEPFMKDPRISLGSRGLATILAFLVPGAGHFYQRRHLKGAIFAVCVLSTFFGGLVLGEGQPVYFQVIHDAGGGMASAQMQSGRSPTERSLGYYVQIFVGIPAMPALVQSWRFRNPLNLPREPDAPLNAEFEGNVVGSGQVGHQRINGELRLEPSQRGTGTFTGTTTDGDPVHFDLSGRVVLGKPVFGSPRQAVECDLASDELGMQGQLIGTIDRPFLDWFQAPRDNEELDRMHDRLSQHFDIACVFTWIAGLLNIMAVWDAFDGPAYGYGDEDNTPNNDKKA